MPFARPTITDLIAGNQADIDSRLPGADAKLRRSLLNILARMHAGAVHGLYGHLAYLAEQLMPDTCESDYLDRWSAIWGVARKSATRAGGNITFTGTDESTIPADTVLQRSDGAEFTTDVEATITSNSAVVTVTSSEPGVDGNTAAGSTLKLTSPISGVNTSATVDSFGFTGGADAEDDDDLRARLLGRIHQPPQGGAASDYEQWALAVPGVTRVWVYPLELGIGTVTVRFMMDNTYSDGIPLAADVSTVQENIDGLRPVTADVTVEAPVAVPLDMTIQLAPNTTTVQAVVEAEIADLLNREAVPGGAILLSRLDEAISLSAGETDHLIVSPTSDATHNAGEIAVLGTITWQDLS